MIAPISGTSLRSQALSSLWKFIAAADRMALIAFPATPFSRLRSNLHISQIDCRFW